MSGACLTRTGRGGAGRGGANLGTGQSCLGAFVSRKLSKPKPSQSGLCGRGVPMGAAGSGWLGPPRRLALLHLSPSPGRCAPNRIVRLQGIWQAGEGNRGSCPRLACCSSLPSEELGLSPCPDKELGVGICGAPQPSGQELPGHPTSPLARAKMRLVDRAPRLPHRVRACSVGEEGLGLASRKVSHRTPTRQLKLPLPDSQLIGPRM